VGANCVINAKIKTMIAPPNNIYKVRLKGAKCVATLLVVNNVIENDIDDRIPNNKPVVFNSISLDNELVANSVPKSTIITAIILFVEGILRVCIVSIKTPIHTDCIRSTTATEAFKYFTHK